VSILPAPTQALADGPDRRAVLWRCPDQVPQDLGPTVAALGQFDGVHRGHRRLVAEARKRAHQLGVSSGVVTFDRHPATVLSPRQAPSALTELDEKFERLEECGVDFVLALPLDAQLLQTSAADFARGLLMGTLQCRSVVVGSNFRFGHRAAGTPTTLTELGRSCGLDVVVMRLLEHDGLPVSSTRSGPRSPGAGSAWQGSCSAGITRWTRW